MNRQIKRETIAPTNGPWYRFYRSMHRDDPIHFGNDEDHRFSCPSEASFGVCYLAQQFETAFLEVFTDTDESGRTKAISMSEVHKQELAVLTFARSLQVADIRGEGAHLLGFSAGHLLSPDNLSPSQEVACALWENHPDIDGVYYPTRHDISTDKRPQRMNLALFDRANLRNQYQIEVYPDFQEHPQFKDAFRHVIDRYGLSLDR